MAGTNSPETTMRIERIWSLLSLDWLICLFEQLNHQSNVPSYHISQMNHIILAIILGLVLLVNGSEEPYKLVIHNTDPEAKCLDGSSPALYVHEGGDFKKIMVFFEGGAFCQGLTTDQVLENCYKRSKTDLGSSKNYPSQLIGPGGYLSTDPSLSKFASWTKVVVRYCDGAQHQGNSKSPISYKDTKLYFRGAVNVRSHFQWLLDTYQINKAEKILFTGASAGGIATFTWSNYFRRLIDNPNNVYTVADAAIYANVTYPHTEIHAFDILGSNLYKVAYIDENYPMEACNGKYPGEEYKCVFIQNSFQFLESKLMFISSEYDAVGMEFAMNMDCMKGGQSGKTLKDCNEEQMQSIQGYRREYLKIVGTLVANNHSIWTIGCCYHSYACWANFYNATTQRVPGVTGSTVADAIERFVFYDERVVLVDQNPWPANQPCAY